MRYDTYQHILLLWSAFRNHQGHGHQRRIGYQSPAVRIIKRAISIQKPEEQGSCNALVAVDKSVIFD